MLPRVTLFAVKRYPLTKMALWYLFARFSSTLVIVTSAPKIMPPARTCSSPVLPSSPVMVTLLSMTSGDTPLSSLALANALP